MGGWCVDSIGEQDSTVRTTVGRGYEMRSELLRRLAQEPTTGETSRNRTLEYRLRAESLHDFDGANPARSLLGSRGQPASYTQRHNEPASLQERQWPDSVLERTLVLFYTTRGATFHIVALSLSSVEINLVMAAMRSRNTGSSRSMRRPSFSHLVTEAGCFLTRSAMTRD
jgi:hypothetical protein